MSCNNCCNNSKTGAQLPTGNSFTNLDFFVIYNPTTGRIEKVQKSTTTGLFLIADNNLSDVDSAATSRNNLDVYSKSEVYTQNQVLALIAAIPTGLILQGNWDANTNTPDITGTTETGYFWIVSVAGNTNLGGITDWEVNDWAVKTSTGWAKVDNTQQNPSWGTIIGTLSNQTDLQNELDEKANLTGGNTFQGDQILEDNLEVQSGITIDNSTVPAQLFLKSPLNNDSAINFIENNVQRSKIGWDDSANLFAIVIGTGAFSAAQVKLFSTLAVLEIDLSLTGNNISNVGSIDADNATFGIEGQSNSISILGDTGEDLTITKNTDGTTTFENTNNETFVFESGLEIKGDTSAILTMTDNGEVLSGTLSYDGNADQFTFNTELYVDGNIVSSNNISLTGQGGSGTGNFISRDGSTGWTGTFENSEGNTVVVKNGIITAVS